jgi:GNAT superfamily N-acetyltransferase
MENNYEIRQFRADDLGRVNAFFDLMGGESRAFFNRCDGNRRGALRFFDGDDSNSIRWMMLDGDKMIGYVFLWDTGKSVVWLGIALADGYKGKGLGAILLSHAKEWAVENGKGNNADDSCRKSPCPIALRALRL